MEQTYNMNIANIMKRIILFVLIAVGTLTISAQTQQGYVKTLGRPNQKGVALSGVSIRVRGGHNAVLSDDKGFFSMMMAGKKEGDAYALQQVQKQGYELNERGIIGRQYAFSEKVPLTIVMVSTKQLQADKQRIENNAYKTAEKNYKTQMALLEKQQQANQITIEKYRQEIQQLQNSFEKYQSLIDGLAEHYARTDYDELEAKEREINLCIENGDLDKAELLLQALDIEKRLAEVEQRIKAGQQLKEEALEDQRKIQKQQEKDAEYLYQLYTIALGRFDNEKARFYIETRAALDTTRVEWQSEAGEFLCIYFADYKKSLSIFELGLRQCLSKEGNQKYISTLYNNIGYIYNIQNDFTKAIEYHRKALEIDEKVLGTNHPDVAISYKNIGVIYHNQGNYIEALVYIKKALEIEEKVLGTNHSEIAVSYNNIGNVYSDSGDYIKALECYQKALEIDERIFGINHPNVALVYNNIGNMYNDKSDYIKALECYQKALEIDERLFGINHPDVALVYNNIGNVFSEIGNDIKALEFYQKSLEIGERIFGTCHSEVAICYKNIGAVYSNQGNYNEALAYIKKALEIEEKVLGTNHPNVVGSYYITGSVLVRKKDFDGAKEMFAKGLTIADQLNENMPVTLLLKLYDGMGAALAGKADAEKMPYPSEVKVYREKALELCLRIYGVKNINTAGIYHNLGTEYAYEDIRQVTDNDTLSTYDITNSQKGLEYLVKSLAIKKELAPHNLSPIKGTENIIRSIAKIYYILGIRNYEKHNIQQMVFYFKKCQDIFKIASDPEDADIIKTVTSVLSQLNNKQ